MEHKSRRILEYATAFIIRLISTKFLYGHIKGDIT